MPPLKQLNCQLEWSGSNVPLNEHGTKYSDGFVSTWIALPSVPHQFQIRLTSDGYIAPGIAMFVYMDGVYQCNRNVNNLKKPKEAKNKSETDINLVVRQKETKRSDGVWLGRAWSFERLKLVSGNDFAQNAFLHNFEQLGKIEVVVLRLRQTEVPAFLKTRNWHFPLTILKARLGHGPTRLDSGRKKSSRAHKESSIHITPVDTPGDEDSISGIGGLFDGGPDARKPSTPKRVSFGLGFDGESSSEDRPKPRNRSVSRGRTTIQGPTTTSHWSRFAEPYHSSPDSHDHNLPSNRSRARSPERRFTVHDNTPERRTRETVHDNTPKAISPAVLIQVGTGTYYPPGNPGHPHGVRSNNEVEVPQYDPWNTTTGQPMNPTNHDDRRTIRPPTTGRPWDRRYSAQDLPNVHTTYHPQYSTKPRHMERDATSYPSLSPEPQVLPSRKTVRDDHPSRHDHGWSNDEWRTSSSPHIGEAVTDRHVLKSAMTHRSNHRLSEYERSVAGKETRCDCHACLDRERNNAPHSSFSRCNCHACRRRDTDSHHVAHDQEQASTHTNREPNKERGRSCLRSTRHVPGDWPHSPVRAPAEASRVIDSPTRVHGERNDDSPRSSGFRAERSTAQKVRDRVEEDIERAPSPVPSPPQRAPSNRVEPGFELPQRVGAHTGPISEERRPRSHWNVLRLRKSTGKEGKPHIRGPKKKEGAYAAPRQPLIEVPDGLEDQSSTTHQVRQGKAALYRHPIRKPKYLDKMEEPYAVFVFKYRTREALEEILQTPISDDQEEEKRRLKALPKEAIIEELLRTKTSDTPASPPPPVRAHTYRARTTPAVPAVTGTSAKQPPPPAPTPATPAVFVQSPPAVANEWGLGGDKRGQPQDTSLEDW